MRTELETKYEGLLKDGPFIVKSITGVNHRPHPYVIGPRHIGWASDHWNGMLGKAAIKDFEAHGGHCAHPNCTLPLDQHTYDTVLFLSLKKDVLKEDARDILAPVGEQMQKDKIDGLCFVETPEKYRIK